MKKNYKTEYMKNSVKPFRCGDQLGLQIYLIHKGELLKKKKKKKKKKSITSKSQESIFRNSSEWEILKHQCIIYPNPSHKIQSSYPL